MNRMLMITTVSSLCACCLCAATNRIEKTMTLRRCIATDGKGKQCAYPAEKDKDYCWRHCKAVRAVNESLDSAGRGAGEAWQSTKDWSTNAWQKTKSGAQTALDNTKKAADSARVGLVELLGGKDAEGKAK